MTPRPIASQHGRANDHLQPTLLAPSQDSRQDRSMAGSGVDLHEWTTPKAGTTIGLAGLGLAAALGVLAGGAFAYGGLIVALIFSGMVFVLNGPEISETVRTGKHWKHLVLPAISVAVILITAFYAFKVKVADQLTIEQFLTTWWKPIASGAVHLFTDPESWFVLIMLSGFWVAIFGRNREQLHTVTRPASQLDEETNAALEKLKKNLLAPKEIPPEQPIGDPDYSLWDPIDKFALFQAAYLWVEKRPPATPWISNDGQEADSFRMLEAAIHDRKLKPAVDINAVTILMGIAGQSSVIPPGVHPSTPVNRKALLRFAQSIGQTPKFLFKDARSSRV